MAEISLYFDTGAGNVGDGIGQIVAGPSNNQQFAPPPFVQGDTVTLRIYLLARNPTYPYLPFTIINNGSLSLALTVGAKAGNGDGDHIVEQFTWNRDANNQYFYANVSFATAEVATALGSAGSISTQWLEVEYTQGGVPTTVFQQKITIHADVNKQSAQALGPGQTVQTVEDANARFAKLYGQPGETITLVSPGSLFARTLGVDDDGNRIDSITQL